MTARYRFGGVEFDVGTGALEPLGTRLPRQPARLLELLIEQRGGVVSRQEIRDELWSDTTVEYDKSLHFCVHQVRTALGDSASEPRFVETIPRQGYRLMPEVERVDSRGVAVGVSAVGVPAEPVKPAGPAEPEGQTSAGPAVASALAGAAGATGSLKPAGAAGRSRRGLLLPVGLGLTAALAAITLFMSGSFGAPAEDPRADPNAGQAADLESATSLVTEVVQPSLVRIGVMPFEPPADWAHGPVPEIAEWILEELTIGGQDRAWIVGPSTTSAYSEQGRTLAELAADYELDYIVNGRFLSDAVPPAMLAELIRTSDGAHIWVRRIERFEEGRAIGLEISEAVRERLLGPGADQARASEPPARAAPLPRLLIPAPVPRLPPIAQFEKHRGVSWEARGKIGSKALAPLEEIYANWIVQTPFGWQTTAGSPEVRLALEHVLWGELDEGLEATARWARERGIRTLLKPHIWLTRAEGKWRSDIAMRTEEDWQAWFESYRKFILHYARLAERTEIEGLVVGTELHQTVTARPQEWRRLIREVREHYSGVLTYAANWYQEYQEVEFWDELDFIGIQAYFPLSTDDSKTSVAELGAGWAQHKQAIMDLQKRTGKPVLFTEIGYKSTPGATTEPWRWLGRAEARTASVDYEVQARAYRSFFETFWHEPWFVGAYFWKWSPPLQPGDKRFVPGATDGAGRGPDFSPQGKPAEAVLREWYEQSSREDPS